MTGTDLRATHTQRTRAAIRAAALTLTKERGYAAMTVDDVAAPAGVSRRTVFNHSAFVNGTGTLLEDLGTLLASGAEAVESERGWLLSFPEIVRDNPEVERAIHERLRTVALSLIDAAGRRLGTAPDDPRTRAVVALAMGIQRSSVDLWSGRAHPWEQDGPKSVADVEVPAVRDERPEVRLADAIHVMTRAVADVVAQSQTGGRADGAPGGPPTDPPG